MSQGARQRAWLAVCLSLLTAIGACTDRSGEEDAGLPEAGEIGDYKVGKPYQIDGVWYYPRVDLDYDETGIASWYGPGFHGKRTANGEIFDQDALTAAHPTLPMPTLVEVTNLQNGKSLSLRINDRGPFRNGRIIDVSRKAAQLLGFATEGTAKVRVRVQEAQSRQLASLARRQRPASDAAEQSPKAAPVEGVTAEALPGSGVTPPATPVRTRASPTLVQQAAAATRPVPDGVVTQSPVSPSDIYVQAGAFVWYDNANRTAARLSPLGSVRIAQAEVDGTRYFRVQLGPVTTVDQADDLLALLIRNGFTESRVVVE